MGIMGRTDRMGGRPIAIPLPPYLLEAHSSHRLSLKFAPALGILR